MSRLYRRTTLVRREVRYRSISFHLYVFVLGDHSSQKSTKDRLSTKEKKKAKILDEPSRFTDTPDSVFDHMLSTSFPSEEKLARFLNGKDKMEFIRCYTDLLDRFSSLKLKQAQWDYYLQIGQTQNIWTSRVPKHLAEKNSMVHAYGRSKSMIEQRRIQIEQKLEDVQKTTAQFEQQMLSQSVPNVDYSSEMDSLSSIIRTFVHEKQQQLRSELEYKRQMLILGATDHRLVQAFFDLNPKKGQVSVQRIHLYSLNSILYLFAFVLDSFSPTYLANDSKANHGRRRSDLLGTSSLSQAIATIINFVRSNDRRDRCHGTNITG